MEVKFSKFTKIGQFRNVVREVCDAAEFVSYDEEKDVVTKDVNVKKPVIDFHGTVKIHGTNSSVGFTSNGDVFVQSRTRVISTVDDNYGFANFVNLRKETFKGFNNFIRSHEGSWSNDCYYCKNNIKDTIDSGYTLILFGEWCCGNIQEGISVYGLEKRFVIFGAKIVPNNLTITPFYLKSHRNVLGIYSWSYLENTTQNIYNINTFKSFDISIDFNKPELSQNKIIELVESVEKECPVGMLLKKMDKSFGKNIDEVLKLNCNTGEGIVWTGYWKGQRYIFKSKGTKHSETKVKTLSKVDIEKIDSINKFVEYAVTENRLLHGIKEVFGSNNVPINIKKTGDFIKWIVNDVIAEELDTINENNLEPKDVKGAISRKASKWWINYLNTNF